MVDGLVDSGSIRTSRVEAAFRSIPRHLFVPDADPELVYAGEAIPIEHGEDGLPISSSSEPAIMATMLEQLSLSSGHNVLEVGTGSGYNAALLGAILGEGGRVRTIDLDEALVERAQQLLRSASSANVLAAARDGWFGFSEDAPYDRIEVTVGVWDISPDWVDQLAGNGILVVPLWLRAGVQASIAFRHDGSDLVSVSVAPCGFMRLRGPHAGPETYVPVQGWVLCDDATDPAQRDATLRLLRSAPTISEAPSLPRQWFTRVALSHPSPVRLLSTSEPWLHREGILLPDGSGLAMTEGERILTFGDPTARDELVRVASASEGELEHVIIRAHRAGDRPDRTETPLLRPAFSYSFEW